MSRTTSSTASPPARAGERRLSGRLGTAGIVFMVIAAAAPLTVIGGNVPLSIASGNGAGAPVGFVVAAVVLLLFSVGFVAMTPHVREAGAFYAYVQRGLGPVAGMGTAFLALLTYTAIQAGIYGYLGGALADVVSAHGGPDVPWWLYALAVLALVAVLGYRHIELSARVLGVALVCEIGVVVLLDLVVLARGGAEGITGTSFTPEALTSGPLGIPVLFALTGFIGFEATAVFRDEAVDPERTVPRATYLAVLIIGAFYAVSSWLVIEGFGPQRAVVAAREAPGTFLLDVTEQYLGVAGRDAVQVLLLTSLFACVLSFHNVVARYQFVLAQRGVLPAPLGRVHPAQHSPHVSSLVQSATALVLLAVFALAGMEPLVEVFGTMAAIATVGVVALMVLTSVAVLVFFGRSRDGRGHASARPWQTRVAPALAVVGLLASLWLVLVNFPFVVSGATSWSALPVVLAAVPVVVFAAGAAVGRRLRSDVLD